MQITAKLRHLRIAPRKARQVVDLVRGKNVAEAKTLLSFTVKKTALPVSKLLNSAVSSAKNNFQQEESNLYISKIFVDEGPKLKRWHPMSRGRAYPIEKKTCHITLVLDEISLKKKETKKTSVKKRVKTIRKPKIKK